MVVVVVEGGEGEEGVEEPLYICNPCRQAPLRTPRYTTGRVSLGSGSKVLDPPEEHRHNKGYLLLLLAGMC